jgi:hypothetical protein
MRRAATLAELIVALTVLGVVLALFARTASGHERWSRQLHDAQDARRVVDQVVDILAVPLSTVSPELGDLVANQASDSAVEMRTLVAAGIACDVTGRVAHLAGVAGAAGTGMAYSAQPARGDRIALLDERADSARWLVRVVTSVGADSACTPGQGRAGIAVTLDSATDLAGVAVVRVTRRVRFNLYRGGDRLWYLGFRDWDDEAGRFNTVQPVAGPLAPYRADSASGLRFAWFDSAGARIATPVTAPESAWRVDVSARAAPAAPAASASVEGSRTVALRRAPPRP